MTLSDEIIIVAIGIAFTYLVLYRKNRFFGNIAFAGCSLALMSFGQDNFSAGIGLIMLTGSLISLVYDVLTKYKKE